MLEMPDPRPTDVGGRIVSSSPLSGAWLVGAGRKAAQAAQHASLDVAERGWLPAFGSVSPGMDLRRGSTSLDRFLLVSARPNECPRGRVR